MVTRLAFLAMLSCLAVHAAGQATSGEILGEIRDPGNAIVSQATVSVRNIDTNRIWQDQSGPDGRFRFALLPIGSYEITVEKTGFRRHVRTPIILRLSQRPELAIKLELAGIAETLVVTADAPLINTTNAEIGVNFDSRRFAELPLAANRNILNLLLQVAGVSQLSSGNVQHSSGGVSFSSNGSRPRSNNFSIDGQDVNNFAVTGLTQEINNPDTIAEVRLVTNQFAPEYGRTTGSVVNIITKSGTNTLHGSAYWFYNGNKLNARSNLDKRSFESAPWRVENQVAGTLGGPIVKNRTFFFGSLLRWTDHRFTSGRTITGVPTVEGQDNLRSIAGNRPQVRALLEHLPPAQVLTGGKYTVTVDGRSVEVPLGTLSGAASTPLDVWQSSARVDHRIGNVHTVGGRYLFDDRYSIGGQPVPSGLTDQVSQRRQALSTFITSFLPGRFNELRVSYQRTGGDRSVVDPKAENIPTIEIEDLGLSGFNNADPSRTAIGAATVLPMLSHMNNYHVSDVLGILLPSHSLKAGIDLRRAEQFYFLGLGDRGRLRYSTLQRFVNDLADEAQIAVLSKSRLDGVFHFRYHDLAFFFQDEWRARPNFTVTYGVRYESPGTPVGYLARLNKDILADHNNDPAFAFEPVPKRDTNNWAPRFGFNYRYGRWPGLLRAFTGQGQLVMRGGYSRAYDQSFNQIFQTIALGFPFIPNFRPDSMQDAFATVQSIRSGLIVPAVTPLNQVRTIVGADFRAPVTEQFSLQFQRELANDWAVTMGWIGTKGSGLFQTVDGNPTLAENNNNGNLRVDSSRGVVRLRCNCASSIYHSMQSSLEKRFSAGFSTAAHYTWSTFIDDASEIFNASNNGDVALAQDSFNRHADRGRSTYDRPHRFAVNGVWELPFRRTTQHLLGHFFGGWQISGFLTLQSGGPFTPLNGADPGYRLSGISGQVGNAIRPNLRTTLDVSRMSLEEIFRAGGLNLFSPVNPLNPIGNAGRNILRADGINRVDLGINKRMRFTETKWLQFRAEFYNLFNSRDFGIPQANVSNPGFGNQGNTDGGNRRIVVGLRYTF